MMVSSISVAWLALAFRALLCWILFVMVSLLVLMSSNSCSVESVSQFDLQFDVL